MEADEVDLHALELALFTANPGIIAPMNSPAHFLLLFGEYQTTTLVCNAKKSLPEHSATNVSLPTLFSQKRDRFCLSQLCSDSRTITLIDAR
jgi:hypothetical protein